MVDVHTSSACPICIRQAGDRKRGSLYYFIPEYSRTFCPPLKNATYPLRHGSRFVETEFSPINTNTDTQL